MLFFIQEAVYYKHNGKIYSDRISYDVYWDRYLEYFDSINVIARVKEVDNLDGNYHIAEGEKVNFIPLPFYNGFFGYLTSRGKIREILISHLTDKGTYVLRVPGPLGFTLSNLLYKNKLNYIAEVVGDPYEVIKHLRIFKPIKLLMMKRAQLKMRSCVKN